MNVWFERSKKDRGTAYVAMEQNGAEAFAALHADKRTLLHVLSILGTAAMMRRLSARQKKVALARKAALRRERSVGKHK